MAHQGYIEPHVAVAKVDPDGKIHVWTTTQGQFTIRNALAEALQISHSRIRLIGTEIGGGFGGKNTLVLEPPAVLLSRKTGKPVKMIMDREEDFLSTTPRRPCIFEVKTGVKRDGTMVAREAKFWFGTGAYATAAFDFAANICQSYLRPISDSAYAGAGLCGVYQSAAVRGLSGSRQPADRLCARTAYGRDGAGPGPRSHRIS